MTGPDSPPPPPGPGRALCVSPHCHCTDACVDDSLTGDEVDAFFGALLAQEVWLGGPDV